MRRVLVVQCSLCRCAISTAASQIGSGSRVGGGLAVRHSSNRCFRCNKSSGTAVFSWDMPHDTTHLHPVTHACRKLTLCETIFQPTNVLKSTDMLTNFMKSSMASSSSHSGHCGIEIMLHSKWITVDGTKRYIVLTDISMLLKIR